MNSPALTIGRLARAADVGIETIRYYQRLKLLPTPKPSAGGTFRTYAPELVDRIRFIKRAQELGFTLNEVTALLQLENGTNRGAIRKLASTRLAEIRTKIDDLQRMEKALAHLVHECEETGQAQPCPIIETLAGVRSHHSKAS
jgi:MerR family mercuric resistance operon transcriptional regulator